MSADLLQTPERRVEGRAKVTGETRFAADHALPGMLHAAFVTSPFPRARIRRVVTAAALAVPGVHVVLTGEDTRPARLGRTLQDRPVLCWDDVLFIGDRVAAVAADSVAAAEEAARQVTVEYEELPPVLDPEAALAGDAPVLHPERETYRFLRPDRPSFPHPNMQGHAVHEHGDVATGFALAHRVFEGIYRTARTHHGYIEPRAAIVWIEDEIVHVITTNKSPFNLRDQLAASLGLDRAAIIVETPAVGGDFGGKGLSVDEYALYFLARATGRPVRSVMRYADDVQATNTRAAATVHVRTAVDRDGRFLAHEARILYDGGAYAGGKPLGNGLPGDGLFTLAGYRVPAARIEATAAYTDAVPTGHARGPGQPQNAFAVESHLDEIAVALGLDPIELRLRNAPAEGDPDVLGEPFHAPTTAAVLQRLRAELPPLPAGAGRGIAVGARHVGRGKTSLVVSLGVDGTAEVLTGVPDQGGGAHTMIARVVATELGLEAAQVRVRQGNTAEAREDPGVGGSRVTPVAGMAAQKAAHAIGLRLSRGERPPFSEVGEHEQRGHAVGIYAYAIDAAVDRETGQVRLLGALLVADVGTVINPTALRGQLTGGFAFGLGQALMEELRVEDGRVTTANLGDYKLPTAPDLPPLRIVLLTDAKGPGPFGAKSVGELSNPAVGPAVANAVAAASGARVRSLPVSAERVLDALDRIEGG